MRTTLLLVAFVSQATLGSGQTRKIDFEREMAGQSPTAFSFGRTRKIGAPNLTAKDLDLSVKFRPVSGRVDRAAGLIWRIQDEDNYYVVRANARAHNVVLYKVEGRKRADLPLKGQGRTYGASARVPSGEWSTLRLVANGNLYEVYLNGTKLYEVEDATFTRAGKVGLWTKGDSVTDFDDLIIVTKERA